MSEVGGKQSVVDPLEFSTNLRLVCRYEIEILEKENLVLVALNSLKVPTAVVRRLPSWFCRTAATLVQLTLE